MQPTSMNARTGMPRWLRRVLWTAFAGLCLFVLYAVGQWRSFFGIYGVLSDWLSTNTTIDDTFIAPLALSGTAIFWALVPTTLGFLLFSRNRVLTTGIVIGASFAMAIVVHFFGSEAFFSNNGSPLRCYALTPAGIRIASVQTGRCPVDKTYSIQYQPMTPEIAPSVLAAKKGMRPNRIDPLTLPPDFGLYSATDGAPTIWFESTKERPFELFDRPGFHPDRRSPLRPVPVDQEQALREYIGMLHQREDEKRHILEANANEEVRQRDLMAAAEARATEAKAAEAQKLVRQAQDDQARRNAQKAESQRLAALKALINCGAPVTTAIAIEPGSPATDPEAVTDAVDQLAARARASSMSVATSFFNPQFVSENHFERAYSGDVRSLLEAGAFACTGTVWLGKLESNCGKVVDGVISCDLRLTYRVLDRTGRTLDSSSVRDTGPGLDRTDALRNATKRLIDTKGSRMLQYIEGG